MSVALPSYPSPNATTPTYLDWGGLLRPIFGGTTQKLNRLGDRYMLSVTMPPMPSGDTGRIWVASLILAQRQGAILPWPQLGFDVGLPGSPVVDGSGQMGSTLNLRGFATGYTVRFGQVFSIIHGGRRYLHTATSDVVAGSDGKMALPIAPMLRIQPSSASICEFAEPRIEGWLDGDQRSWTVDVARVTGLSFSITEAK